MWTRILRIVLTGSLLTGVLAIAAPGSAQTCGVLELTGGGKKITKNVVVNITSLVVSEVDIQGEFEFTMQHGAEEFDNGCPASTSCLNKFAANNGYERLIVGSVLDGSSAESFKIKLRLYDPGAGSFVRTLEDEVHASPEQMLSEMPPVVGELLTGVRPKSAAELVAAAEEDDLDLAMDVDLLAMEDDDLLGGGFDDFGAGEDDIGIVDLDLSQEEIRAQQEAKRLAQEEDDRRARELEERRAREEDDRRAREAADRTRREDAERRAREDEERERRDADRRAREDEERRDREAEERRRREEDEEDEDDEDLIIISDSDEILIGEDEDDYDDYDDYDDDRGRDDYDDYDDYDDRGRDDRDEEEEDDYEYGRYEDQDEEEDDDYGRRDDYEDDYERDSRGGSTTRSSGRDSYTSRDLDRGRASATAPGSQDVAHVCIKASAGAVFYYQGFFSYGGDIGIHVHRNVLIDVQFKGWTAAAIINGEDKIVTLIPLALGASYKWMNGRIHPYVGGDAVFVLYQVHPETGARFAPGFKVRGGCDFKVTESFGFFVAANLGFAHAKYITDIDPDRPQTQFIGDFGAGILIQM